VKFSGIKLSNADKQDIALGEPTLANGGKTLVVKPAQPACRQLQAGMACAVDRWPQNQRHLQLQRWQVSMAEGLLWLCRWLTDGAAMWLWGSSLFVLALLPAALRQDFWQQQTIWNRCAARVLLLATLSALPLHSAVLADGWADSWHAASLLAVMRDTGIGRAWCWQLLAALPLWLATSRAGHRHALLPPQA
jgi:hypothetical protein